MPSEVDELRGLGLLGPCLALRWFPCVVRLVVGAIRVLTRRAAASALLVGNALELAVEVGRHSRAHRRKPLAMVARASRSDSPAVSAALKRISAAAPLSTPCSAARRAAQ